MLYPLSYEGRGPGASVRFCDKGFGVAVGFDSGASCRERALNLVGPHRSLAARRRHETPGWRTTLCRCAPSPASSTSGADNGQRFHPDAHETSMFAIQMASR